MKMLEKDTTNRYDEMDVAKGITLFFVVLGHLVNAGGTAFTWIFSFHMMLFFFVSGYCFNSNNCIKYSFFEFFQKKVKTILYPFFIVALVAWVLTFVIPMYRVPGNHFSNLIWYYSQPENLYVGQIWFLFCLFWTELFFFSLYKYFFNKINIQCVLLILFFISVIGYNINLISFDNFSRLPWKIDSAITAVVFFSVGFYCKEKKILYYIKYNKVIAFVCAVCTFFLGYYISEEKNGYVNICDCQYSDFLYFYLAAFCGILFILLISCSFRKIKILQWYGKNTLYMFSLHSYLLYIGVYVLNLLTDDNYVRMANIPITYATILAIAIYILLALIPPGIQGLSWITNHGERKIKNKFAMFK